MTIYEPMTLATDYLLTIAAGVFAARLWRTNRMWALAFLFTAAASFFGGTSHGFGPLFVPMVGVVLWKLTVFSIGFASFFLLAGSGRILAIVAVVKLVVYISWMITHNAFIWVIADYGTTLILVGAAQLIRRTSATPWVLGSIGLSIAGAAVQASHFSLHRHFNYNDLYHVIQLAALWLLYRGGREMSGARHFGSRSPVLSNQASDARL
ncbi:MAG TPA: hypothetical protein VEK57_10710 [Thermoanaerobaculia bacterium]|nr:hypothetical protein [Thermoanaerobaculia bacterium]